MAEKLHSLRPHRGQVAVARTLRKLLSSSGLLRDRHQLQAKFKVTDTTHEIPASVQEVYSLRCIPQIVGPVLDTLAKASREITIEINSVTDNPVIDMKTKSFLHGGNFHGDYIATAMDQLKASLVKLMMLSERRTNFFLNPAINKFFPPFMNLKKPGFTMGLQGLQFVATSTTSQSQTLAFPQHVHSIPTNGDNQDVVSMGTDAALMTSRVIENAYIVLSIEMVTLAQTIDFLGEERKYSNASRDLFNGLRKVFPPLVNDRVAAPDLEKAAQYAKQCEILDIDW
jgi:histidine ammonia-lyase